MTNFFKSRLTDQIDQYIKQTMPTSDKPVDAWMIAKAILSDQEVNYRNVQLIRSYLNSLAAKKLLTSFGEDHALEIRPRVYYIAEPFQATHWSR